MVWNRPVNHTLLLTLLYLLYHTSQVQVCLDDYVEDDNHANMAYTSHTGESVERSNNTWHGKTVVLMSEDAVGKV